MGEYIIGNGTGFVSVAEPYVSDRFVKSSFVPTVGTDSAAESYLAKADANGLMRDLLAAIAEGRGVESPVGIVDCGVYMGTFTILLGLLARQLSVPVRQIAYEANPLLIDAIRSNLETYGIDAEVVNAGVGGKKGKLEFRFEDGNIIGGKLHRFKGSEATDLTEVAQIDVVPLDHALAETDGPGIVKIDIEGTEVAAFRSIKNSPNKLNNLFIIEFAPWQGRANLAGDKTFGAFLLEHFRIFNVGNWMFSVVDRITDMEGLNDCLVSRGREHNSDLVLVPRSQQALAEIMERHVADE